MTLWQLSRKIMTYRFCICEDASETAVACVMLSVIIHREHMSTPLSVNTCPRVDFGSYSPEVESVLDSQNDVKDLQNIARYDVKNPMFELTREPR